MTDDERSGSCPTCFRRDPDHGELLCRPCQSRVTNQLDEIPRLCELLAAGARPEAVKGEERIEEKAEHLIEVDGSLAAVVRVEHHHLVDVNAAAVAGQSSAPRVAGSRDRAVPISLDRTDLLSDARVLNLTKVYPEQREDQVGHLAVATVLDGWCRDFAETRRETPPRPWPYQQCSYLADRLDWAFTSHAAVDEFAGELGDLWHVLRRTAGLGKPKAELCEGIPCKSIDCDLKTLYRVPGSDYIECDSCGLLLTTEEYQRWVKMVAAAARKTVIPAS